MKRLFIIVLGCLLLMASAGGALAHTRSVSYSTWRIQGRSASVVARVALLDQNLLERAGVSRSDLPAYVRDRLRLLTPVGACEGTSPRVLTSDPAWIDLEWNVSCPSEDQLELESTLVVGENPSHLHMARVSFAGQPPSEHVIDERTTKSALSTAAPQTASFSRFVLLGIEHIATGWDHLLFLVMLLFAAKTLRRAAWVVTGFTLGHAITLTLTAAGVLVVREAPVEALIAVSIGLLAVENVWLEEQRESAALPVAAVGALVVAGLAALSLARGVAPAVLGIALFAACYFALVRRAERPELARASVASLFGLVHGFAFARALTNLELEPARLVRALVGMNLGVELGQVAAVALAWPVLLLLRRASPSRWLTEVASTATLALACYWFVQRAFSG